jgi:hypothetical protein
MGVGVGPEPYRLDNSTDVGIVMFGESLQPHYANDQARNYMERAGVRSCHTNKIFLSKLLNWVLKSGSETPWDPWPYPDGGEARKTVRTKQGAFLLRALRVLSRRQRVGHQIMILIEDQLKGRGQQV